MKVRNMVEGTRRLIEPESSAKFVQVKALSTDNIAVDGNMATLAIPC